jgi:hypothetical protein
MGYVICDMIFVFLFICMIWSSIISLYFLWSCNLGSWSFFVSHLDKLRTTGDDVPNNASFLRELLQKDITKPFFFGMTWNTKESKSPIWWNLWKFWLCDGFAGISNDPNVVSHHGVDLTCFATWCLSFQWPRYDALEIKVECWSSRLGEHLKHL